jgi:hypothetical protein
MPVTRRPRPANRTLRGWAIAVLIEASAIRGCDEHGWMQGCADPHARERAFGVARHDPPVRCFFRGFPPGRRLFRRCLPPSA